jgi:hypothetical protein
MQYDKRNRHAFVNRRDWGSYLSALQSAATYPKVLEVVKSGRAWFTQGATQASNWLSGSAEGWAAAPSGATNLLRDGS